MPVASSSRASVLALGVVVMTATGCRSVLGIEDTEVDPRVCTYVTQRLFFGDKPVADERLVVGVVTQERFEALAASVGVTLDPNRGHGLIEVVDCEGEPDDGATVVFDPALDGATPFAVRGNEVAAGGTTSVEGVVGAFHLDTPTEHEVTAFPGDIEVESSAGDIVTRGGEVARIVLKPNSEVTVEEAQEGEWSCVGTFEEPMLDASVPITLTVDVQASSAFVPAGVPVAGLRVAVCLSDSASCEIGAPVPEGQSATTDANGRAEIQVDTGTTGFDGHLVLSGTDPACSEP